MKTKIVRWLFKHRALLQRFIVIRHPVLLTLPDFKLYVLLTDWAIGARIAVNRRYEAHVTRIMRPLLQPGMTVVDIGANIGYYTLLAASRVGPDGQVIAFEPGSTNCNLIRLSVEANHLHNVTLHTCAVAEYDGMIDFSINADNSNGITGRGAPDDPIYQVPVAALDTVLRDEPRIDLIKMDIEGAEGRALQGMQRLIQQHRPLIFSEFGPGFLRRVSGIAPEDYLDQLRAPGYDLFALHPAGHLSATPQSNEEIMGYFGGTGSRDHIDLLARPQPDSGR